MPLKRKYGDQNPYQTLSRPTKMLKRSPKLAQGRRRSLLRTAGLFGIESKYLDVYGSLVAMGSPVDCSGGEIQPEGGCTGCLSAPAQGDSGQSRDGRKIKVTKCFVTGEIYAAALQDQADALPAPTVFVALVMDTQANGATVVSEQVFTNPNDTALTNCMPLRNMGYTSRYKVLAHKTITLAPVTIGTDGANTLSQIAQQKGFTLSWIGDMPVTFGTGTNADIANVTDNALHLIAFNNMTQWSCVLSFNSRIRFVG